MESKTDLRSDDLTEEDLLTLKALACYSNGTDSVPRASLGSESLAAALKQRGLVSCGLSHCSLTAAGKAEQGRLVELCIIRPE
jgi:hypothetical protein